MVVVIVKESGPQKMSDRSCLLQPYRRVVSSRTSALVNGYGCATLAFAVPTCVHPFATIKPNLHSLLSRL